ncbi:hypothetical protein D3C72_1401030 [compost metagenome]
MRQRRRHLPEGCKLTGLHQIVLHLAQLFFRLAAFGDFVFDLLVHPRQIGSALLHPAFQFRLRLCLMDQPFAQTPPSLQHGRNHGGGQTQAQDYRDHRGLDLRPERTCIHQHADRPTGIGHGL